MVNKDKYFLNWLFIVLLSSSQFVPAFGAIDKLAPQFLYLSIVSVLSSYYIYRKSFRQKTFPIHFHPILILFGALVGLGLMSSLWAFNPTETIITSAKYYIIFLCLLNLSLHFTEVKLEFRHLAFIFSGLLFSDIIVMLLAFVCEYDLNMSLGRSNAFVGLSSNLNVTGFSTLFKIPFVVFFLLTKGKLYQKIFSVVLFCLGLFFIFTSGSRGAILSTTVLLLLFSTLYLYFEGFKKGLGVLLLLGLFLITFHTHNFLFQNSSNQVSQRIGTLSTLTGNIDTSVNERLIGYRAAVESIKENPILGHGLGNWKIVGNKYVGNSIEQYKVPVHAHNDFLEFFTELGVFGFSLFIGFFFLTISNILSRENERSSWLHRLLLLVVIVSFILDAFINFPIARPIALNNLILLVAYVISVTGNNSFFVTVGKNTFYGLICLGALSVLSSAFVYKGLVDEIEFKNRINHSRGFNTPLEVISRLNHTYPNINHTTIPIITIKGLYYWKNGFLDEAKKMLKEGNKINPYLYVSEVNLASIYLEEGKIDSAYTMAKKAFYGLPKNERHANVYQSVLAYKSDFDELDRVFDLTKKRKKEIIYRNHLEIISRLKVTDSFSNRDKENANLGIKLFPSNPSIRKSHNIIVNGPRVIAEANNLDKEAKKYFRQKKYKEAILKWNLAKKLQPTESAYYLNIAQAKAILGEIEASNVLLDSIKLLRIYKGDGQWELLRATNDLSRNQKGMACQNLLIAYRLGKVNETLPLIRQLKCPTQ